MADRPNQRDPHGAYQGHWDAAYKVVKQLEDRCRRAEESGIGALREFSRTLRRYDLPLGEMR